jgi:hypothetical protein
VSHGGKGSKRRPESEPGAYGDGYERIFGKGMLAGDKPLHVVGTLFASGGLAPKGETVLVGERGHESTVRLEDWPESLPAYRMQGAREAKDE